MLAEPVVKKIIVLIIVTKVFPKSAAITDFFPWVYDMRMIITNLVHTNIDCDGRTVSISTIISDS